MPMIKYQEGIKFWVKYINLRIKKNKNFIAFYSGQTGSGKSWSCLGTASLLDPDFNVDRIVFDPLELLELINSGKLKKGSVIVFEETGVSIDSHKWQSTANRSIKYLMQTFRHKNFILLLNAPYADYLDKNIRKLLHGYFECMGITNNNENVIKPLCVQYNDKIQKFYHHFLRVWKNGDVIKVSRWTIPKAPDDLIKAYEEKKTNYTTALNKRLEAEIKADLMKNRPQPLTTKQAEILDKLKENKSPLVIADELGVNKSYIYSQINYIKKKNYTIEPIKDSNNRIIAYDIEGGNNMVM